MTEERADTSSRDDRIDALVAALDGRVAAQLVSGLRADPGVMLELLNVDTADLLFDFDDAPDVRRSGLYKQAHDAVCDGMGREPYAAIFALFELDTDSASVRLLRLCGEVVAARLRER